MIDVLVTCFPHGSNLARFPQVRGYYLAEHLSRAGIRAVFRQLPVPDLECEVLICTEYQCEMPWFDRYLARDLSQIKAERMFCLIEYSLHDVDDHFSREYCAWFAERGGVLCHLAPNGLEPYEHWIGIGVDADVVRPDPEGRRDQVVFDFPRSDSNDPAAEFDTDVLRTVRDRLPGIRVLGSGAADAPIRGAFDGWLEYGQEHAAYAAAAFSRTSALVAGWPESMGLAVAEAQVAGACVVSTARQIKRDVLVADASIEYVADQPGSLADGLVAAGLRDAEGIRRSAMEKFDYAAVAQRTLRAIGLGEQ